MWQCRSQSRVAGAALLLALGGFGCCKQPTPATTPRATQPVALDPLSGCFGDIAINSDAEARRQADFEIAKLDAKNADWSVYAHHPNVYVRGVALLRLRESSASIGRAQLARVAQLLGDNSPIYSTDCIRLFTSCSQRQGLDVMRSHCLNQAETVGHRADGILAGAEPKSVATALVSALTQPGLTDLGFRGPDPDLRIARLQTVVEQVPEVFVAALTEAFPKAKAGARLRLLNALTYAPLGSGNEQLLALIVPALQSNDTHERVAAAIGILRLTDHRPDIRTAAASAERRRVLREREVSRTS